MAESTRIHFHETKVGFDVEFVEKHVDKAKIKCSICLFVLRKPVQAIRCGHRFCKSCIEKLRRQQPEDVGEGIICPVDRQPIENIFDDVGYERDILNNEVKCNNATAGCKWTKELFHLEEHQQMCPYENEECSKCGMTCFRKELEHHLEEECVDNIINCKYSIIGCLFKGRPTVHSEHLKEKIDEHMFLQATNQKEVIERLENEHEKMKQEISDLQEKNRSQKEVIERLENEHETLVAKIPLFHRSCPFTFTIKNVSTIIKDKFYRKTLHSEPFYFLNGYRRYLIIYCNGMIKEYRNNFGVYFGIQKGPFDEYLEWPMLFGIIKFTMIINGKCVKENSINCKEDKCEELKDIFSKPPSDKEYGFSYILQT